MPPTQAFGADVRSLHPQGFTFVLLPAEENIPSGDALLPMLENGKKTLFYFFFRSNLKSSFSVLSFVYFFY